MVARSCAVSVLTVRFTKYSFLWQVRQLKPVGLTRVVWPGVVHGGLDVIQVMLLLLHQLWCETVIAVTDDWLCDARKVYFDPLNVLATKWKLSTPWRVRLAGLIESLIIRLTSVACLAQLNSPERRLVSLVFVFTCIRSSTSHDAREYCWATRVVVIAGLHGLTYKCAILIDNSACLIASVSNRLSLSSQFYCTLLITSHGRIHEWRAKPSPIPFQPSFPPRLSHPSSPAGSSRLLIGVKFIRWYWGVRGYRYCHCSLIGLRNIVHLVLYHLTQRTFTCPCSSKLDSSWCKDTSCVGY